MVSGVAGLWFETGGVSRLDSLRRTRIELTRDCEISSSVGLE